ncbi:MAG: hypothetical protein WD766_00945 [Gemmatimonadota bacterium]
MATGTDTDRSRAFDPSMASGRSAPTGPPGWDLSTERRIDDGEMLANALAWFSLGLGAAELLAPGRISRSLGMEDRQELFRAYGVREIAKGVGILHNRRPAGWLWARVAGDVLDLATLAGGLARRNRHRERVAIAIAAVAGVAILDLIAARQLASARRNPIRAGDGVRPPIGEGAAR